MLCDCLGAGTAAVKGCAAREFEREFENEPFQGSFFSITLQPPTPWHWGITVLRTTAINPHAASKLPPLTNPLRWKYPVSTLGQPQHHAEVGA
jgi:hypothetical protein